MYPFLSKGQKNGIPSSTALRTREQATMEKAFTCNISFCWRLVWLVDDVVTFTDCRLPFVASLDPQLYFFGTLRNVRGTCINHDQLNRLDIGGNTGESISMVCDFPNNERKQYGKDLRRPLTFFAFSSMAASKNCEDSLGAPLWSLRTTKTKNPGRPTHGPSKPRKNLIKT